MKIIDKAQLSEPCVTLVLWKCDVVKSTLDVFHTFSYTLKQLDDTWHSGIVVESQNFSQLTKSGKWRSAERISCSLVVPLLEKRLDVFSYYLTHQAQIIRQDETKLAEWLTHRCWLADYRLPLKPVSCVNHQLFCWFKSGLELTHRKLTISWVSQWQSGLRQLNLIAYFRVALILKPVYAKHGSLKTSKWISSKTVNKF